MVMQKIAKVPAKKANISNFVAVIASLYSLYALYGSGLEAMTYGSIATFAGWILYGFISYRFDMEKNSALVSNKAS
jgi:putrescine:ornithine antiporter